MKALKQSESLKYSAGMLFALTAFFWFSQYACTSYLNPEMERMGASASFMGLVSGGYGLTQLILRLPLGIAADRQGRQKPFIILGCVASVLSAAGMLLFYNPSGFFVARLIAGVASSSWVSFTVLYGSYFMESEAPRRISHLNLANYGGRLACFVVAAAVTMYYGVVSAFWVGLVAAILSLVMSLYIKDVRRPSKPFTLSDFLSVTQNRHLLIVSLLGLLTQMVAFSTYYGFTPNLAVRLQATKGELSTLNIVLMASVVLGNYTATRFLIPRYGAMVTILIGCFFNTFYCFLAPFSQTMSQLFLCQVLGGFGASLTFSILLGQSIRDIAPHQRTAAMGFFQAVYGIGMTVGPILMGLIIDGAGIIAAYIGMAALSLVATGATARLFSEHRPEQSK